MEKLTMEKMVNYCKQYGFIFQGSEIYGGLSNSWDYGPLGRELKENIKRAWWKKFIQEEKNSYGLDAAIIMNPEVWVASGHVASFADPLIDCKSCKSRHRADKLIEDFTEGKETGDGWANEKLEKYPSPSYKYKFLPNSTALDISNKDPIPLDTTNTSVLSSISFTNITFFNNLSRSPNLLSRSLINIFLFSLNPP